MKQQHSNVLFETLRDKRGLALTSLFVLVAKYLHVFFKRFYRNFFKKVTLHIPFCKLNRYNCRLKRCIIGSECTSAHKSEQFLKTYFLRKQVRRIFESFRLPRARSLSKLVMETTDKLLAIQNIIPPSRTLRKPPPLQLRNCQNELCDFDTSLAVKSK